MKLPADHSRMTVEDQGRWLLDAYRRLDLYDQSAFREYLRTQGRRKGNLTLVALAKLFENIR